MEVKNKQAKKKKSKQKQVNTQTKPLFSSAMKDKAGASIIFTFTHILSLQYKETITCHIIVECSYYVNLNLQGKKNFLQINPWSTKLSFSFLY